MDKDTIGELAKLLGARGGKARAAKLTQAERSAIATKAAKARWGEKKIARKRKKD